MNEMVERVARALYESPGSDLLPHTGDDFPLVPWEEIRHPGIQDDFRIRARAAIEAMREPTEAMCLQITCGYTGPDEHGGTAVTTMAARQIWRAMIDAALAD